MGDALPAVVRHGPLEMPLWLAFTRGYTAAYDAVGIPVKPPEPEMIETLFANWHDTPATQRVLSKAISDFAAMREPGDETPTRTARLLADTVAQAHDTQENWKVLLEMFDGMIRDSVSHGWTEDQARLLIISTMIPRQDP